MFVRTLTKSLDRSQGPLIQQAQSQQTSVSRKARATEERRMSVYEIRVKGHLDPRWSDWFDGLRITNEPNREALFSGYIADQAALHGVLAKVRDLNLRLISVTRIDPDPAGAATQ
jgi:hypothetical protein